MLSAKFLLARGKCCNNGCVNCPYKPKLTESTTMIKLKEFIPGTLTDIRKGPGDVWPLVFSGRWAAIGPGNWRMVYKKGSNGKKNAIMWAKTGKDRLGNTEADLRKGDEELYGKGDSAYV